MGVSENTKKYWQKETYQGGFCPTDSQSLQGVGAFIDAIKSHFSKPDTRSPQNFQPSATVNSVVSTISAVAALPSKDPPQQHPTEKMATLNPASSAQRLAPAAESYPGHMANDSASSVQYTAADQQIALERTSDKKAIRTASVPQTSVAQQTSRAQKPQTNALSCLQPHLKRVQGHAKYDGLSQLITIFNGSSIQTPNLKILTVIEEWRAKNVSSTTTSTTKPNYATLIEQPRTFFGKYTAERAASAQCIDQIWLKAAWSTLRQENNAIAVALKKLLNYIEIHQTEKSAAEKIIALQSLITKILNHENSINMNTNILSHIVQNWQKEKPLIGCASSHDSLIRSHRNRLSAFFCQETTSMALITNLLNSHLKKEIRMMNPLLP